jgi:ferredoxin-NADP reductase
MTTAVDPTSRIWAAAIDAYKATFVTSPAAPVLSRPRTVRFTGFERDVVVDAVAREADDVVSLTLRDPAGATLPRWTPGAHLDLFLPSGRQRQYSLCGDAGDDTSYRIAVRLIPDGDGGSREIHGCVRTGQTLTVRGPRQAFALAASESYMFIAGGIGITPILGMVRAARAASARWKLVYLGRSRATMPFLDELERFGAGVAVRPDDEYGPPDVDAILRGTEPGAAVYLCGPPPLMAAVREALPRVNPTAGLHAERFAAPPVAGGSPFTVTLARSGTRVPVAADESALTAVRREVPGVTYSCRQGFCGSCRVRVLPAKPGPEKPGPDGSMLLCVQRPSADSVVVDL